MFSQFDRSGAWTSGIGIKQDKAVKKSSLLTNFKSINVSVSVCLTLNFFSTVHCKTEEDLNTVNKTPNHYKSVK